MGKFTDRRIDLAFALTQGVDVLAGGEGLQLFDEAFGLSRLGGGESLLLVEPGLDGSGLRGEFLRDLPQKSDAVRIEFFQIGLHDEHVGGEDLFQFSLKLGMGRLPGVHFQRPGFGGGRGIGEFPAQQLRKFGRHLGTFVIRPADPGHFRPERLGSHGGDLAHGPAQIFPAFQLFLDLRRKFPHGQRLTAVLFHNFLFHSEVRRRGGKADFCGNPAFRGGLTP